MKQLLDLLFPKDCPDANRSDGDDKDDLEAFAGEETAKTFRPPDSKPQPEDDNAASEGEEIVATPCPFQAIMLSPWISLAGSKSLNSTARPLWFVLYELRKEHSPTAY